jgi:hypothetical protein
VNIKSFIPNNKLFFVVSLSTFLLNYYLLHLPLFKEFSYEFAAINGLLFFISIPLLNLKLIKENSSNRKKIFQIIVLLSLPLIVVLLNLFSYSYCSLFDGITFYFVISLVSGLIAFLLSEIIYFISPKRTYIIYILVLVILISIPFIEIYRYPQIYFYSPLIGFFPGSIYDEDIIVDKSLIIYRTLNIMFFLSFYFLIKKRTLKSKLLLTTLLLVGAVVSFLISPFLGFSTNEFRIKKALSVLTNTDNFIIYSDQLDSVEQKIFAMHCEYYFYELNNVVKNKPSKKIKVFLFSNSDEKRKIFGSGNADVAKPWLYQIYLDKGSWKSTLKHEIAHVFSAEFGTSLLKLSGDLSPFLIEGFATSQDPFVDIISIDYLAAIHQKNSDLDVLHNLQKSLNFFGFNSTLSYVYAGSFSRYIINKFGIEKYKLYYKTNDFERAFNKQLDEVISEYKDYLVKFYPDSSLHQYNYYFGRKSLIQKECPRFIGKQIKKAWSLYLKKDFSNAKKIFADILDKTTDYSALIGSFESLIQLDSAQSAKELMLSYIEKFYGTPYEYLLKFKLADVYVMTNETDKAMDLYEMLVLNNPNLSLQTLSQLRIKLLRSGYLDDYLSGDDSIKFQILVDLNEKKYYYASIPTLLNLIKNKKLNYEKILSYFDKTFTEFDEYSFFALLKLSQYMVENLDFTRSRKMAALAKRLSSHNMYDEYLENNYQIVQWFYFNSKNFKLL